MKKKSIIAVTIVLMFLLVVFSNKTEASGNNPLAISPGSETNAVTVLQSCPTFSWSAVDQAAAYIIAVFEVNNTKIKSYEEMAAITSPLISKEITGPALSWTLPGDKRLKTGSTYSWYVQALDATGNALGFWSSGKLFKVEQEVRFIGIEEKLGDILRDYGVNEETIENVLGDLKSKVREVVVQGAGETNTEGNSGVRGFEGNTNTFYGLDAGDSITTGYNNTFIGYNAGYVNTTGICNTFIGRSSGAANVNGNYNTCLGYFAGNANTSAEYNTFLGYQAGMTTTTGNHNAFLGNGAGKNNTTGFNNTFLGDDAGLLNTTGEQNTFLGYWAGYHNTTGYQNTFLGNNAGRENSTGAGNLFIGYNAGYYETGSAKLYIDNSDTSSPLIYGEFDNNIITINGKLGIGTATPDYAMELETTGQNAEFATNRTDGATCYISGGSSRGFVGTKSNHPLRLSVYDTYQMELTSDSDINMRDGGGYNGTWNPASSRELKENIYDLTTEEAFCALEGLVPVKFNYKDDKSEPRVGFIAEDVPDLVAMNDRKSLGTVDILAVVTQVLKQQHKLSCEQQETIQEQQKTISDLQERIEKLEKEDSKIQ